METKNWKAIEPTQLKNAIALFNEDWMALAAGHEGACNAMTVSWGQMGELWGKPVVTVYVRQSRYTKQFMDSHDHFTLSAFPADCRKALAYIGKHSGREGDKLAEAGLHLEFTALGNPTFREATLCLECRTLYSYRIDPANMADDVRGVYADGDVHTVYVGEIVNATER